MFVFVRTLYIVGSVT